VKFSPAAPPRHDAGPARARVAAAVAVLATAVLVAAAANGLFTPRETRASAAPDAAPVTTTLPPQRRFADVALDTRRLMADVSIARVALAAEMPDDARTHVEAALALAARLAAAPGEHGPWLPLQDEEHVVRTLDDSLARRHELPLLAADAHAVRTRRALDPGVVLARLRAADAALTHGDVVGAAAAIDGAESSVVAETDVRDLPLERVHDNLVLARELATDGDRASAAEALGFARAALADAELADGALRSRPEAVQLGAEIAALQTRIGPVRPAGLQALHDKVRSWIADASAWVSGRSG
jgi:hypothetical protein